MPACQRTIRLWADGVELDVRLTSDGIPIVYHYCYLHEEGATTQPTRPFGCDRGRATSRTDQPHRPRRGMGC
jgi:glycerophosphoryl diester phosphodiesterase